MGIEYRKEFFDRDYSAREAYARVWKYARKYKFRIFAGIICGMLTAGTLLPIFSVVQPALKKASENERVAALTGRFSDVSEPEPEKATVKSSVGTAVTNSVAQAKKNSFEREMDNASQLPSWFPKAEKIARKIGFELRNEDGTMGVPLLLLAIVGLPFVALLRWLFMFLNQYCLTWAASHVVADLRVDLLRKINRQSLQFHGRIDVGQLMMRAMGDPMIIQGIIQGMLAELARAPFEIFAAVAFIIYFAIENHMLATLGVIVIGLPAFMLPIVGIGKRIRRWSRKTLERNSAVGGHIHEMLTCARVIKAYGTEEYENRFEGEFKMGSKVSVSYTGEENFASWNNASARSGKERVRPE